MLEQITDTDIPEINAGGVRHSEIARRLDDRLSKLRKNHCQQSRASSQDHRTKTASMPISWLPILLCWNSVNCWLVVVIVRKEMNWWFILHFPQKLALPLSAQHRPPLWKPLQQFTGQWYPHAQVWLKTGGTCDGWHRFPWWLWRKSLRYRLFGGGQDFELKHHRRRSSC